MVKQFSEILKDLLENRSKKQKELANFLGYDLQRINNWVKGNSHPRLSDITKICEYFRVSADELLGINIHQYKGIKWDVHYPSYMSYLELQEIEKGISLFKSIVIDGKDLDEIYREDPANYDWKTLPSKFTLAARSGAFRLLHVPRVSPHIEQQLKELYKLREVIIADLPFQSDETNIGAECVAFLAATIALKMIPIQPSKGIGVGPGGTLIRLAELSIPGNKNFDGVVWAPLMASSIQNYGIYSANYVATILASRHLGSRSLPYPYLDSNAPSNVNRLLDEVLTAHRNMTAVFATVNHLNRKPLSRSSPSKSDQFRAVDYGQLGSMNKLYETLNSLGLENELAGEFLGVFMNSDGEQIEMIREEARQAYSQVAMRILREMIEEYMIFIVASGLYKAPAILTLLRNRLANALVIDSHIAKFLLDQA